MNTQDELYAQKLGRMIAVETVSAYDQGDEEKFNNFRALLKELFPNVFKVCSLELFEGHMLLKWNGNTEENVMLMNHYDVVEATGEWSYPAFAGIVADGKVWGRGALDDKGPLFAMLQACEELISSGYVPQANVYLESVRSEETDGSGSDKISSVLKERGLNFTLVLDEGGAIVYDPIGGADGTFAMIGVGEKGVATLKFIAKSNGGHASTPEKNSPIVRLAKFVAECERRELFKVRISRPVAEMLKAVSVKMKGVSGFACAHPKAFAPLLKKVLYSKSPTSRAMLKTTLAFTMCHGAEGDNVMPEQAYVVANMRISHHEGKQGSYKKVIDLAKKYGIETEIVLDAFESGLTDVKSTAYKLVASTVNEVFDGVYPTPYVMTGASDCKYFSRVSSGCIRFAPFKVSDEQLSAIHGVNESIDVSALAPAVEFYKTLLKKV